MKYNIFAQHYDSPLTIQDAGNPANLDIEIDVYYFGDAMRVIPKKFRQDIRDNYITLTTLNKSQVDKLTILSNLDYIRDGRFKGFNKL